MEWYEIKADGRKSVKFPEKVLPSNITAEKRSSYSNNVNKLGGIIKKGEWGWLAKDAMLQIVSLKYGHTVSTFEFAESKGYENCVIKCVDQVFPNEANGVYLAVCLERMNGDSFAAIYSVDHSTVLSCIEVKLRVSCCRFMESRVCTRSLLQNFNGCLALGSEEGVVVLLDLNMSKILAMNEKRTQDDDFIPCHVIDYNMPLLEIHRNFKQCQQDGVHFGLQIEVMEEPCSVCCLLPIDLTLSLAVGLEDGRLILYDLTELQIFYIANADKHNTRAPLVKMDFLEPPDDPRPCFYLWALHEDEKSLTAVLHSLLYEKRVIDHNIDSFCFLEIFQSSYIRLMLPLESKKSKAISCQSITKSTAQGEDDANCLCAFNWYAENEHKNKLMIFDLNQWYKEEMPFSMDLDRNTNFLAGYVLNGQNCALHSFINPATIAHFNSFQRFEEHFYPSSLSFDCTLLMRDSCVSYSWEGAQNRFVNILRSSNASIFLEPDTFFNEIIRIRLMPQFYEHNSKTSISKNNKYEIILSVALEYNCFSLLRDCAKCWVDGSFMGNLSVTTCITLSTLTDWAWKRATEIKSRCNDLSKGLFDFGGYPLDQREQKELGYISRQLKLLADLQDEVLTLSKPHIPEKVHNNLEQRYKSLRMASDYQDILLWLLNIGLLPEASPYNSKLNVNHELVPYPYKMLKELFANKRVFFGKISDNIVSKKTGRCRLLYIDALIEHESKGNVLREYWLENNGDGVYPPTSIEAMLRVMLVPDMSYDSKCAVLLYFFLDLNMIINDEAYKNVVANFIKFPSVFKLSASLIKTVQAFWNLDHGHFLPAVEEFISPFNKNQNYPQWLLELLTETLLTQNAANLALRILEARSSLISPILKLQTLLANELISEAFHFARSKQDDALLEQFFKCCLCNGKFGVIRDLALSEKEGQLVQDILKNSKMQNAENLHFVYLLQKSKYIEAVSYMDEISKSKCIRSNAAALNTPNLVMAAYNTTMTPVTQGLTDVYFRIKNKIRKKETDNKSPVPLSCQLIKQNANNLLGGIYHSSALSAHFATHYWGEMENVNKNSEETNSLLSSNNAPFLRKAQMETNFLDFEDRNTISYPRTYKVIEKRTLAESDVQDTSEYEKLNVQENPKKRRKVMDDEIVQDLSNVLQMSRNMTRLNNTDFLAQPTQMETEITENILTQPPSLKSRVQASEEVANATVKLMPSSEIHSILKSNTPEPMERHTMRRDLTVDDESKNIRFDLPSSESEQDDESASEEAGEAVATKNEIIVSRHEEPKKIVTRSVSVDSSVSISSSSSSKALSEENFYSPISSQNTSLAISLNDTKNSAVVTANISNISEGPKARKPLERHSVERREKSKSPEPQLTTTVSTKEHSPTVRLPEMPSTSKLSPSIKHVFSLSGEKKFLTLDSRNSGILDESVSPPVFISSIKSTTSNIKEFVPQVSSSKVVETHSQFSSERIEKTETQVKISEHSTVVGSFTYMESNIESIKELERSKLIPAEARIAKYPAVEQLDTTLGMSSYDLTLLDSTAEQQSKSFFHQAKTQVDKALENKNVKEVSNTVDTDLYGDLECSAQQESDAECELLYDAALGVDTDSYLKKDAFSTLKSIEKDNKTESEVIVLSSSDDEEEDKKYTRMDTTRHSEDSVLSYPDEEYDDEEETGEDAETSITSPEYEDDDDDDDNDDEDDENEDDENGDNENENDSEYDSEEEQEKEMSNENLSEAESHVELKKSKAQSNLGKLNVYADGKVSLVDICDEDEDDLVEDKQDDVEDDHCVVEEDDIDEVEHIKASKDHSEIELNDSVEVENSLVPEQVDPINVVPEVQSGKTQDLQNSLLSEDKHLRLDTDNSENSSCIQKTISMAVEDTSFAQNITDKSILSAPQLIETELRNPIPSSEVKMSETDQAVAGLLVKDHQIGEIAEDELKQVETEVEVVDAKQIMNETAAKENKEIEIERSPPRDLKSIDSSRNNLEQSDATITPLKESNSEVIIVTSSNEDLEHQFKEDMQSDQIVKSLKETVEDRTIPANNSEVIIVMSSNEDLEHQFKVDKPSDKLVKSLKETVEDRTSAASNSEVIIVTSSNEHQFKENLPSDQLVISLKETVEDRTSAASNSEVIIVTSSNEHQFKENLPSDQLVKSLKETVEDRTSTASKDANSSDTSVIVVEETKDDQATKDIRQNEQKERKHFADDANESSVNKKDLNKEDTKSSKQTEKALFDSPIKGRGIRAGSVPARTTVVAAPGNLTPKSRSTRRVSVDEDKALQLTPRTRRSMRASSMQPLPLKEKEEVVIVSDSEDSISLNRSQRSVVKRGTSVPPTADVKTREPTKRGTSQPPVGVTAQKISLRRSSLLDAINESPNVLDSPSTRTRSRFRLNSNDSDLDSSLLANEQPPQTKRTRKNSTSSSIAEQPASTPTKRSRRNSVANEQAETGTPRTLRPRSVVTVQEETVSTPKARTPKRKTSTDESLNETILIEGSEEDVKTEETEIDKSMTSSVAEKQKKTSPKHESQVTSSSYSLSRRLTRTQLAMLEKSAALTGVSIHDLSGSSGTLTTPSVSQASPKRVTRRRNSRSTAASQHESDDAESVVSHRSSKSNSAATRRVTRSSVKDKDEVDDDLISVNSSVGSEKPAKRRSNESKNSPGSKLPVIPEDETDENNVEPKKAKTRRGKH